ncbi:IS1 family transposase [Vibrio mediterranei]|nr:IS1 family transposase [Vibrio mediterranei]
MKCRFCNQSEPVRKHGKSRAGFSRFRCTVCKRTFQSSYSYEACKPGVKEQIISMAIGKSGVREIGRILHITNNTVLKTIKDSKI